jgi:hypothetical protein
VLPKEGASRPNLISAPVVRSILDEPTAPGLRAQPRTCIVVDGLIGRTFDFDAFLTLDLLLRDLARATGGAPPVVALATSEAAGLERLPALRAELARFGAELAHVPVSASAARASYDVHLWLAEEGFSTVVAIGGGAALHCALVARRLGLAHARTRFVHILHAPTLWACEQRGFFANDVDFYARDFLERTAAAHADRVLTLQAGLLPWLERRGWPLGRIELVDGAFIPHPSDAVHAGRARRRPARGRRRLSFAGNVDDRYGLDCFLEALEIISKSDDVAASLEIELVGMSGPGAAEHPATSIAGVLGALQLEWRYTLADTPRAVFERIAESDLVVCCSAITGGELLPAYCAAHGAPLFCTLGGADLKGALDGPFDARTARSVARDLKAALSRPPAPTAAPSAPEGPALAARISAVDLPAPAAEPELPLASVILCHEDQPDLLHQALYAIGRQTYPSLDVIVVDNDSRFEGTLAYLRQIEPLFKTRGWRLVRRAANADLAVARNEAIELAQGELVIMLDVDGVARSVLVADLVRAAQVGKLDAVSCFAAEIDGDEFPAASYASSSIGPDVIPLGAAVVLGGLGDTFTGGAILYRRTAVMAAGGYREGGGGDHELAARLALGGARLEVAPKVLWLRRPRGRGEADHAAAYRRLTAVARAYGEQAGEKLQGLFTLAMEQHYASAQAAGRDAWRRTSLPPASAGAALRDEAPRRYPLTLASYALELGRPMTALDLAAGLLDDPARGKEALEIAKASIRAAFPAHGEAALRIVEEARAPNGVRVDLAGCLVEAAAESGQASVLSAALDILAGCDTADPEAFAALVSYSIDGVDPSRLDDSIAAWRRLPTTHGLQHLVLRGLLARAGSAGKQRSAWRKRLDEISALYG